MSHQPPKQSKKKPQHTPKEKKSIKQQKKHAGDAGIATAPNRVDLLGHSEDRHGNARRITPGRSGHLERRQFRHRRLTRRRHGGGP